MPPIILSTGRGSIGSETRGIVQDIDDARGEERVCLVGFLASEEVTGESVWLREIDLFLSWRQFLMLKETGLVDRNFLWCFASGCV